MHDNYIQGSWRRYHTSYHKPPTPVHVGHILRIVQNTTGRLFDRDPHKLSDKIDWLNDNFSQDTLDSIHKQVCDGYRSGEYKKRGRAFASPNRSKASNYSPVPAYNPPSAPVSNGHAESSPIDTAALASSFVSKAVFDNHDAANEASFNLASNKIAALDARISSIVENRPTIVHIKPIDAPIIDMGVQHASLPDLITTLRARQFNGLPLNAWLYGPAGTGKSKACEAVIKAFGKQFYGNGKTIDKIEVMGYCDGYGKYHRKPFREAYEHGHGYCADEIDAWSPEATTALQGALAGDWCAFDDGMVKRHPDFIFIAAGNTTGKGATIEYVGRMQQDAAFLDRFVFVDWPHDNGLEDSLVSHKDWLAYVRQVRANLARTNDIRNHLVTMRAAIHGDALLAAEMPWDKVVDMTLRKGLPQNSWDKIK